MDHMAKITKQVLDMEIQRLKFKGLVLKYNNGFYSLYNNGVILLDGTAKEIYLFLRGISYGLGVDKNDLLVNAKTMNELPALHYLNSHIQDILKYEASKVYKYNTYAEYKNYYDLKITRIQNDIVNFNATVFLRDKNGVAIENRPIIHLKNLSVRIPNNVTVQKMDRLFLRAVNVEVLKKCKSDKSMSIDYLLWVTSDDLWYLGINDENLKCDTVTITPY